MHLVIQHRWAVRDPAARHFVKPVWVAEVEFSGWTPDNQIRHARFLGHRIDKEAEAVERESGVLPPGHSKFQTIDPWQDYARCQQTLATGIKTLRLSPTSAAPRRARSRHA
jgi:hypothetical protein